MAYPPGKVFDGGAHCVELSMVGQWSLAAWWRSGVVNARR
jgi:hypothetical protein